MIGKNKYNNVIMEKNCEGKWVSPYWHPAVTTDAVLFAFDGKDINILLIQRKCEPYMGHWALPGGFLEEKDHSAMECVKRELVEETHVKDVELKEFGTFSDKFRDPRERVITIAFRGLVEKDAIEVRAASDAKTVEWFKLGDLPRLAFDHEKIIQAALNDLKSGLLLERIGHSNKEFTLPQLHNILQKINTLE